MFLRSYTDAVTLVPLDDAALRPEDRERLLAAGVTIEAAPLNTLRVEDDKLSAYLSDGRRLRFDAVYSGMGIEPATDLAASLGVRLSKDGRIVTDDRQRCSVAGAQAAKDVVNGPNQLAVAIAQGEIASVDIHNALRRAEKLCLAGQD